MEVTKLGVEFKARRAITEVEFKKLKELCFKKSEDQCDRNSTITKFGIIGIPVYVAIDGKPENGCEIQNSACVRSGIMMRLQIVKHFESEDLHTIEDCDNMPHGTSVLKHLVLPWTQSGRCVCFDSYFASVTTVEILMGLGFWFIGVVKTTTKNSSSNVSRPSS